MKHIGFRYAGLIGSVVMVFSGFVACGAQLYQVSLVDDSEPRAAGALPEETDPAAPNYGLHAPNGWRTLPIAFKTGMALTPDQQKGLRRAMETWETAVGRKLFDYKGVHQGVTGDSFKDLYSSLDDGVNGHYLDDDWTKTGKKQLVLATTIWDNAADDPSAIASSDIRFNSQYYLLGDSYTLSVIDSREVVDIQTLALHELGHLLGLSHVRPSSVDPQSIMVESLYIGEGLANRRLSPGDVQRVQRIYGCVGSSCDVDKTLAKIDEIELSQRDVAQAKGPDVGTSGDTAH